MYYDDFYYETSEFEMQIDEFKESLRKSVKKEFQEEMERLRKENESLQDFKEQKDDIEREHQNALRNLENDKQVFEREIKSKRLVDLLGDFSFKAWAPESKRVEVSKCDACDDGRYIHYKTPSGKDAREECSVCGGRKYVYEPAEVKMFRFTQSKSKYSDDYHIWAYFSLKNNSDSDDFCECRNIYDGSPFEKVSRYDLAFRSESECQRYCDWLNEEQSKS